MTAMVMVMVRVTTTLLVDMDKVMITPPDTEMDTITLDTTSRDTDRMDTETIVSSKLCVSVLKKKPNVFHRTKIINKFLKIMIKKIYSK